MAAQNVSVDDPALLVAWRRDLRQGLAVVATGAALLLIFLVLFVDGRLSTGAPGSVWTGFVIPAVGSVGFVLILAGATLLFVNRSQLRQYRGGR